MDAALHRQRNLGATERFSHPLVAGSQTWAGYPTGHGAYSPDGDRTQPPVNSDAQATGLSALPLPLDTVPVTLSGNEVPPQCIHTHT